MGTKLPSCKATHVYVYNKSCIPPQSSRIGNVVVASLSDKGGDSNWPMILALFGGVHAVLALDLSLSCCFKC